MDEKPHNFSIYFLIIHPTINPDVITEGLGLTPYMAKRFGDDRKAPNGNPLPGKWRDSRWGYSLREVTDRNFFSNFHRFLVRMEPRREFIVSLVDDGAHVSLTIQLSGHRNIGACMKPETAKLLVDMKIELGLEIFPYSANFY
ncbi:DUF4279 domain-containing protein [Litoreibacter roseus]|uniref:DUF4279 domain-containing protein n=1 Tax=Litoreibacter roseus TaxID=2601869 RepID=A0A6N6JIW2_9RHOB|nr:DUF4279 domain-containing protein [Litoreibacter roseus]GFE65887.1 hypothetical protein KIN_29610 [Litoreibacter roseus]